MIQLCLFRHGRTTWNAAGRYQGVADVDLDSLGRAQAGAIAGRCQEIQPQRLFSSDLRRCADVAREIGEAVGIAASLDQRLRERDVGEWSGLTREEVSSRFPQEYNDWISGEETVRPGGGETVGDILARVQSFVETARSGQDDGTVVAVSHAAWIRTCVQWVLGMEAGRRRLGVPSQGSLTVVRLAANGEHQLEAFNDRGHLLDVEDIDREAPAPPVY